MAAGPDDAMAATAAPPRVPNAPRTAEENLERLTRLHAERSVEMKDEQYVLGTGDVLAIRAFEVEELDRRVRVDHDGTVTLPLLETVPAAGLTVSALQQELTRRLGEYMYNPHVAVFVEEYRSHQVAVVGAVRTPGLITLRDRELTVLDALSAAGGMSDAAAGQIFLIPSEGRQGLAAALTGMLADPTLRSDGRDLIAGDGRVANDDGAFRKAQPIMIDVNRVPDGVETFFFSLPVRDGDVVLVRPAGHFILTGWVHKPGTYPLRPGLTLRGALATGGGLRFAAKKTRISIHRLSPRGGRQVETVDFKAIGAQKAEDVFIDEGDVIEVKSSAVKLVPYGFYALVADVVRFGAGIRMVP
jgi:protein involved in polysaccharide export with SLBB domain